MLRHAAGVVVLVLAIGQAGPARADFFDDVRRTFQKDIPRTFEQDIPRAFGAAPKKPAEGAGKPAKPPPVAPARAEAGPVQRR